MEGQKTRNKKQAYREKLASLRKELVEEEVKFRWCRKFERLTGEYRIGEELDSHVPGYFASLNRIKTLQKEISEYEAKLKP